MCYDNYCGVARVVEDEMCYFHIKINFNIPEYLISTPLIPAEHTDIHTDRENEKKLPQQPFQLSPVVRLITPLVILSGYTAPHPLIPSILRRAHKSGAGGRE